MARKTMSVLLVDDHDETLRLMSRLLSRSGHTVRAAGTIAEARSAALGDRCDILISDLTLPDGSGLDLMRELALSQGMRGIALSGHSQPAIIDAAKAAGFQRYLVKPITLTGLLDAIDQVEGGLLEEPAGA